MVIAHSTGPTPSQTTSLSHCCFFDEVITQVPARYRVHYSIGWGLGARERTAIDLVPASAGLPSSTPTERRETSRGPRRRGHRLLREGPRVTRWPADTRIICRRETPHHGA
jgi:hypothetical protein